MAKLKSGKSKTPAPEVETGAGAGAAKQPQTQEAQDAGQPVPKAQAPPPAARKKAAPESHFPIVGVGASAGGLEAFTQLLRKLPLDTGMGFVLVQHMAPRAHSMLPEILAKVTRLPVTGAQDGLRVAPNQIYIAPPGLAMTLEGGVLRLRTPSLEPRGRHWPIDDFLRSLADDQRSQAIGVILSGTASDGVQGLQTIKSAGGVTFAQDVKTAKYTGMPENAIAAGCVDFILSPEQIAAQLARLARHPFVHGAVPAHEAAFPAGEEGDFSRILVLLKSVTGVDFTYYKPSTIKRRILRRMMLEQVERLADYPGHLQTHPEEVKRLYEDILINVTSFFREPEAFAALQKMVFPELTRNRASDEPIRIWVPGCATGEEAYSIAISLLEFLGDMSANVPIQIFATDIEDAVIDRARAGVYPEAAAEDIGPERLRRFFVKVPGGYQVSKAIRDMCVFARQNLIKDPPFSRLDLISCRNVLIYFGPVLQKKVIPIFHFALKPAGYLLLGKSEALSAFSELFTLADKRFKIYLKKPGPPQHLVIPALSGENGLIRVPDRTAPVGLLTPENLQQEVDRLVLARYAPAGVVIDEQLKIIHFRGRTGPYLEPAPGEPNLNLLKMAREGLQMELRAAVYVALKNNTAERKEGLRLHFNGTTKLINLEVLPLRPAGAPERYLLVTFEDVTPAAPPEAVAPAALEKHPPEGQAPPQNQQIGALQSELTATKEYLQAIAEEHETAVEELKSSNEELMSANEELQSINEEMETSKEELQSANEELATLNEELENRNTELSQANSDLNNLLSAVEIAIVMLGPDLHIRRFNTVAQEMLNLIPTDLGRPLGDIRLRVEALDLEAMIREVLEDLVVREQEVRDREGRWYSLRLRPYRTADNKIDGVVLTLVDVDALKRSLDEAQAARDYAQGIIATVREPLVVLDGKLRVVSVNDSFYRTFQVVQAETEGRLIYDLGNRQWDIPSLRELLDNILSEGNQQFQDFEVEHDFPGLGRRIMLLNARRLVRQGEGEDLILLAIEDITDRKQMELALKGSETKLRELSQRLLAVQEEERQALSWELHESLAQRITALKMQLRTFQKKLPAGEEPLQQDYSEALGKIDDIVETLRRRAMELSPQMLEDLGLAVGLKSLCESYGVACVLDLEDLSQVFTLEDQISIYRIFQEALNNVSRHAQATQVTLAAKTKDGRVEFLVEDNGQGFDVGKLEALKAGRKGIGLSSMSERVRNLTGTFKLESQAGVGTRIFFTIPTSRK